MSKYPGNIITSGANAGYSVFLDGSGDYLSLPTNTAFTFGTGDFTVEGWFNQTATTAFGTLFTTTTTFTTANQLRISTGNSNNTLRVASGNTDLFDASSTFSNNVWNHFALARSGTTLRLFLNGVSVGSVTNSTSFTSDTFQIGDTQSGATRYYFAGYISNFRVVKGTALYTAAFTPPTQLLNVTNTSLLTCNSPAIIDQSPNAFAITANGNAAASTFTPFTGYTAYNPALGASTPGVWTVSEALEARQTRRWNMYDPYFNLTTLLLHGNGTNGAQNNTFLDSSSNNFTITRNGNTTQGTFSPFSQTGWSVYLNGSSSLRDTSTSAVYHITGNFTVEGWYWFDSAAVLGDLFGIEEATAGWAAVQVQLTTSRTLALNMATTAGAWAVSSTSTATVTLGTWNHIAVTRSGSAINLWLNGVSILSASNSNALMTTGDFTIIGGRDSGAYITGYVSNFRFVNGTALYTSAFTPSTAPLTTTSQGATATEVELLTCQSNRFVDNSSNAFTLTVNGTPSVQAFSPFYPVVAYTPQAQGGSGYFDGSGDYLTAASNSAFYLATGDFTVEAWVYKNVSGRQVIVSQTQNNSPPYDGWLLYVSTSNYITFEGSNSSFIAASTTFPLNQWVHVAAVKSSSTTTLYVNGSSVASGTVTINNFAGNLTIGQYTSPISGSEWVGYISNMRIVKGTAVYTAAFTPPTAPLTAITNTSLLLNFTNAGIIDSTGDNVLETVSGAQISTAQSKFGGSSLLFNGSSDYLVSTAANTRNLVNFGTGDFTVECWVYFNGTGTNQGFLDSATSTSSGTSGQWFFNRTSAGNLQYGQHGVGAIISAAWSVSTGVWYHIAICRSSGQSRLFANGVQLGSTTSDTVNYNNAGSLQVGVNATPYWMNGYIDEIRISRYARYTANFTPQTSQWQDQ
jgi:hypothetical protein